MRVEFVRDFDWQPPEMSGRITIAYRTGMKVSVRRICAEAAMAAGAAIPLKEEHNDGA